LIKANSITPYEKDIAKMLVQDAEVDFAPDCPTKKNHSRDRCYKEEALGRSGKDVAYHSN
jgi:hypothetical protein